MMRPMLLASVLTALATATFAGTGDEYRFARVRFVDPSVAVQRAAENDTDEVVANAPFVPGDRIWSDGHGRAEFQLFDGSLLWLNARSKLDYVGNQQTGAREQVLLRLWSGALVVRQWQNAAAGLAIQTNAATVRVEPGAVVRVDADSDVTRVSVREGAAQVDSDEGAVRIQTGECTEVRAGGPPDSPWRTSNADEFDAWVDERNASVTVAGSSDRYLPEELAPYAAELDRYGNWYYEGDAGYVWRPRVDAGWSPYFNGRWTWAAIGWTWVSHESWGWAPSHYGRWGSSARLGWYWIPDRVFGPAWVSWAVGSSHIGWCALDRWNRPIHHEAALHGPHARSGDDGWTFVRRDDFSAHDLPAHRAVDVALNSAQFRVFESNNHRPARGLDVALDAHQPPPAAAARIPALLRRPESQRERARVLPAQRAVEPPTARDEVRNRTAVPSLGGRPDALTRDDARSTHAPEGSRVTTRVGALPRWLDGANARQDQPSAPSARPQTETAPRARAIERRQPEREPLQEQRRTPDHPVMDGIFGRLGNAQREAPPAAHESSAQSRSSSNSSHAVPDSSPASSDSARDRHPSGRRD